MAARNAKEKRKCRRKKRYPDYDTAFEGAKENGRQFGRYFWVYECPWCGKFHLKSGERKYQLFPGK